MEPNASVTIQETIKAGRIVEARTLLTLHENTLSEEERSALDQEIDRLHDEANALIVKAEAMENEGRAEEAKALYEAASIFAADFPGIQSHIKRIEETLFLTRAVKRRSRRIRESIPEGQRIPQKKQFSRPLGAILTTGIIALMLFFFFFKSEDFHSFFYICHHINIMKKQLQSFVLGIHTDCVRQVGKDIGML